MQLKYHEFVLICKSHTSYLLILQFCTEQRSMNAVLSNKFQND